MKLTILIARDQTCSLSNELYFLVDGFTPSGDISGQYLQSFQPKGQTPDSPLREYLIPMPWYSSLTHFSVVAGETRLS
jgi:hypothetical protein